MPFNTFNDLVTGVGSNTNSPRLGTGLGAAVIANILDPFCGGQAFAFSQIDSQTLSDPVITIKGKAVFPQSDLNYFKKLSDPLPVTATITRTNAGDADVTLVFDLPADWIFSKSFVDLPNVLVPGSEADHDTQNAIVDHVAGDEGATLHDSKFVVKSSKSSTPITGQGTIADAGLNFTARWTSGSVLGVLQAASGATFTLSGPIVVPPDQAPPPLGDKFPWELETAPGIHLKAGVGRIQPDAATSLQLDLNFQVYSPLLNDWLVDHPAFAPVSGFSGTLTVPDTPTPRSLTIAALKLPGVDEILMTARADPGIPFGVTAVPVALLGSALPGKVQTALPGQLVLETVAMWLARTGGALKVEQIAAKFALSKTVQVGGTARSLLGLPANAFASRAVGTIPGPYNISATDTFSIAIDGATPPINIQIAPNPSKTTDALVSELNNQNGFAEVAIAENIGGKLAITSGQSFTPSQWPFKAGVALTDVSIAVLNPFDSSRVITAALDGTLALALGGSDFVLDVTLNLTVDGSQSTPEFEILGEQRNTATVPLANLFDQDFQGGFANVRAPDRFTKPAGVGMHDLRFSVTPATKAFALSFAIDVNGPKWDLGDQAVGNVHFSISNDGTPTPAATAGGNPGPPLTIWELRAESPDGLKIGNLFQSLTNPDLPPPLLDVNLKSFSVSSTKDGFKSDCSGEIPVDGLSDPLAITIGFEKSGDSKTFSGEVVVAGVAFDLILNKNKGSEAASPAGAAGDASVSTSAVNRPFQLNNVLAKMLPAADAIGLPDVEISLDDVLLFYRKPNAEKGRALFVIDTGAGLKLNSGKPGASEPQPQNSGILALLDVDLNLKLRLLAATGRSDPPELAGFKPDQVGEMNDLLPDGIDKLPTEARYKDNIAIRKGFDAVLKLGDFAFGADSSGDGANDAVSANTPNGGGQALAAAAGGSPANPGQPGAGGGGAPASTGQTAPVPADTVKWFSVQKSLGPVHVKRIGAGFIPASTTASTTTAAAVKFALDASAEIAGLTVELDGFSIQSPLKNPKVQDITIGLNGLALSYQTGALEIGGQFLKDPLHEKRFLGAAVLRTAKLSLTAFGAFGLDPTNLFVFAVLDYPLGGPTFFFVTGLAAGLGYNVDLKLPAITGVKTFPFVTAVLPAAAPSTTDGVLQQLSTQNLVPPLAGSYWVAAGIRFSSFQLIDSFALLFVKFGQDLEFMLLGLSEMSLPKNVPGKPIRPAYLNVELAFRVSVKPAAGEFSAEALLTENSFVFHPDCRLSGGFAFYAWFGNNPHAGDFVLTVGGYHPRFNVPAHYPQVPRLGINWPMDKLSIKGEAYFAITPSCIMAGGGLEASYKDGSLEASFSARADFLISWEPFFYDIAVSISLRAALNLETLFGTLRLATELSAGIHIWGPEFAGTAHVTWNVISFDVSFGATNTQPAGPQILKWEAFRKAFLPAVAEANKGWRSEGQEIVNGTATPVPALQICQVNIEGGLAREVDVTADGHTRKEWVVLPNSVQFSTQTAIPATSLKFRDTEIVNDGNLPVALFGFAPMGGGPVLTPHIITITGPDAGNFVSDLDGRRQKMPKALWDKSPSYPPVVKPPQPTPAIAPSADLLPDPLVVGLSGIRAKEPTVIEATPIPVDKFAFTTKDFPMLPLRQSDLGKPSDEIKTGFAAESGTDIGLTIGTTSDRRTALIKLATEQGFPSLRNDPLTRLKAQAGALFQSLPMLGHLGSGGTEQVSVPPAPAIAQPPVNEDAIATIVAFLISTLQYAYVSAAGVSTSDVGTTTQQLNSSVTIAPTNVAAAGAPPNPDVTAVAVGSASQDLTAGQTVVLSVSHTRPRRPHAPVLEFTEGLNFRVATFDAFGRPVQDVAVPGPEAPGRRLVLPLNAGRVAVTALPLADATASPQTPPVTQTTFGWTGSSSLIQAAPFLFLADGASVQTQSSFQQSQNAGPTQSPVIRGSDLVRINQVPVPGTAGNQTRSGQFRTLLPGNVLTFAVLVQRSGSAAEPGLATQVRVTRADIVELHLQPVHILRDAPDQFALLYRVPANLQDAAGAPQAGDRSRRVEVVTQATGTGGSAGNWEIQGVMGITEKVDRVRRDWESFRLRSPLAVIQPAQSTKPGRARMTVAAA